MKRQVNLYTDAFRPKKILLPLEQIIGIIVLTLVLVVIATFALQASLDSDKLELMELRDQQTMNQERVAVLQKEVGLRILDESLVAANKRLANKIAARREMVSMLDSLVIADENIGLSDVLLALSRQASEGLWLTRIYLRNTGEDMRLEGATLTADSVPGYLQRLRQEDAFVGRHFTLFNVKVEGDNRDYLSFVLRSKETEPEENAATRVTSSGALMAEGGF